MFEFIIFCGPPGVGKTSQSTAEFVSKMIDTQRYNASISMIKNFNAQGYNYANSSNNLTLKSNYLCL